MAEAKPSRDYVKRLSEICPTLNDISFALAMEDSVGNISYHERTNQPCYGELRKYARVESSSYSTPQRAHESVTDITGKNNVIKPTDLHFPFPDGKPLGLCVGWKSWTHGMEAEEEYFQYTLGPTSPWMRGLFCPANVDILRKDGRIIGMVLKSLAVDPTVLVHFLIFTSRLMGFGSRSIERFKKIKDMGLSDFEAIMMVLTLGDVEMGGIHQFDDYVVNIKIDPRRVRDGNSHDLTGGTLEDRYDYNRPDLGDIFKGNWNVCKELSKDFPPIVPSSKNNWECGYPLSEVVPKFKDYLFNYLERTEGGEA